MFPKGHRGRKLGISISVLFAVLCVVCIFMATCQCYGTSPQWWKTPLPICVKQRPGLMGAIYLAISFDYLADICLTGTSVYLLCQKSDLPTRERRLVIGLFFLSIPSLLASVYFSSLGFIIDKLGPSAFLMVNMGGHLQSSITLFVSNLLVFVLFYRFVKKEPMHESDDDTSATDEKATMSSADHRA